MTRESKDMSSLHSVHNTLHVPGQTFVRQNSCRAELQQNFSNGGKNEFISLIINPKLTRHRLPTLFQGI